MELLDTSATSICAREEEFTGGSASSSGGRRKGGGRASGSGFYRRAAAAYKEGSGARGLVTFLAGAEDRRLPFGRAPLPGRRKESTRRRKEGRASGRAGATLKSGARSQREGAGAGAAVRRCGRG